MLGRHNMLFVNHMLQQCRYQGAAGAVGAIPRMLVSCSALQSCSVIHRHAIHSSAFIGMQPMHIKHNLGAGQQLQAIGASEHVLVLCLHVHGIATMDSRNLVFPGAHSCGSEVSCFVQVAEKGAGAHLNEHCAFCSGLLVTRSSGPPAALQLARW